MLAQKKRARMAPAARTKKPRATDSNIATTGLVNPPKAKA
jgi:hypothetical protein